MTETRKNEIYAAFMQLLADDADLNILCDKAEEYLGLPIALTITTRTIVAHSKGYSYDLIEEYTNHLKLMRPEERIARNKYVDSKLAERHAFLGTFPMMRYAHIDCGCFYGNSMLGVLDVPVSRIVPDMQEVLHTVELLAPIFLQALRLSRIVTPEMKFSMQLYLSGLLFGDPKEWVQSQYIEDSELKNIKQWCLVYLPHISENKKTSVLEQVYEVCSRYEHAWPIEYSGSIVILKKAYEHFNYDRLLPCISPEDRVAVSEPFSDLSMIKNHLHACQRTVDLGAFEEADDRVLFVDNYKMPISYLVLKQMPNGMSLYHPSIPLIEAYDAENQTEYYKTLRSYLLNCMDHQKIADKLHIHKNTVAYRLQRLEALFHLDLKDCRTTTALYLSLFEKFKRRDA